MKITNSVLFSIPMVLFICDICPERQWAVFFKTWHTLQQGPHVQLLSSHLGIGWQRGGGQHFAARPDLHEERNPATAHPHECAFSPAHFYRTHRLSASRNGRHVVYAGGRSEAAQEPPGGKSFTACPLVRRGDIGGGGEDAVRRGSALRSSPPQNLTLADA